MGISGKGNSASNLPVQVFVGHQLPDDALGLGPVLVLFEIDGLVDHAADPVEQHVLVPDHVGEDAAELFGQILPPRDAVSCFTRGRL